MPCLYLAAEAASAVQRLQPFFIQAVVLWLDRARNKSRGPDRGGRFKVRFGPVETQTAKRDEV